MMKRRHFLSGVAAVPIAAGGSAYATETDTPTPNAAPSPTPPNRIGISTYSFWGFRNAEMRSVQRCLHHAADMGFDGVEILERQLDDASHPALHQIKREAFSLGLDLMGYSTHQAFVTPDAEARKRNVEATKASLQRAHELGIPTMRVNTGTWGTAGSFDALMAAKGIEEPREGFTDEDAFPWVIEAYQELAAEAGKLGVVMGLENHWGLGRTAAGGIRIIEAVDSQWLRATLDTGNFLENIMPQIEAMAPYTFLVQAKTYDGGGRWYTLDLDNKEIARVVRAAGYRGYVSLEFEGSDDPLDAIPGNLAMLREAWR